jgi:hypothetical protein
VPAAVAAAVAAIIEMVRNEVEQEKTGLIVTLTEVSKALEASELQPIFCHLGVPKIHLSVRLAQPEETIRSENTLAFTVYCLCLIPLHFDKDSHASLSYNIVAPSAIYGGNETPLVRAFK